MTPQDTPPADTDKTPPRRGPWRRFRTLHWAWQALAWLLALAVTWLLACWLVLPPVARSLLADNLTEVLSRPVTVQAVRLNPFTLRLEIEGVAVGERDGQGNLASLDLLVADVASVSLLRWAVVMDRVELRGPFVHLVLGPDGTNVDDLLTAGGGAASAPPPPDAPEGVAADSAGGSVFPVVVRDFAIQGGRVEVDDQVRGRSHVVADMNLRVPFTSSLPDDSDRFVQPSFHAVVNGSPLDMTGRAKPFASSLRSEFELRLDKVDLVQWWPYVPAPKGLDLASGILGLDLALAFERGDSLLPRVSVSGGLNLADLAVNGPDGPLVSLRRLDVELERFGLLEREVRLGLVRLDGPVARLALGEDGVLDWMALLTSEDDDSSASEQSADESSSADEEPFVVTARRLELGLGRVEFKDRSVAAGFSKIVEPLDLAVDHFSTAPGEETAFDLTVGPPTGRSGGERLAVNGTLTLDDAEGNGPVAWGELNLSGLVITDYAPYYAPALPLALRSGGLGARCAWSYGREGTLAINGLGLGLRNLALVLPDAKDPFLTLPAVDVRGVDLDLDARRVAVAEAVVTGGKAALTRLADGTVDLAAALATSESGDKEAGDAEPAASAPKDAADATDEKAWAVSLGRAVVDGLRVRFTDRAAPGGETVLDATGLKASVQGWALGAVDPLPVALSLGLAGGSVAVDGELALSPLSIKGAVDVSGLNLRPFAGYLPAKVSLTPKGELAVKGGYIFEAASDDRPLNAAFTGSVALAGLSGTDGRTGPEVAGMERLDVRGLDFNLEPLEITVSGLTLEQPTLRLVREADGRMNLARLLGAPPPPPAGAENATLADAGSGPVAAPAAAPESVAEPAAEQGGEPPFRRLALGEFALTRGLVTFRDLTLDPAFASELNDLEVRVSGLSMPGDVAARVTASAMQDGQAPVSVDGTMGMAGDDMQIDLRLLMDNYGLTRVSPYSLRYVAHAIERGKLSLDIGVRVEGPVLDMDNVMRFGQLAFGPRQDVPGAADVPLGLAMALLADGEGNMDLDVPVQGRLDDPQFRLGKVIFKAVMNLIWKVVTSPFALIGNIFGGGGGEDLDQVAFRPGLAGLPPQAQGKLETLTKALTERPRLKLEITGRADPAVDGPALADYRLDQAVRRAAMDDMGQDAPASPEEMRFEPGQYEEYLREVYEDAPMDKEEGFLGPKEMPVAVMEALLKEHYAATPADLDQLARERAGAVRDGLVRGGVDPERIYIRGAGHGAAAPGGEPGDKPGPRADLKLE